MFVGVLACIACGSAPPPPSVSGVPYVVLVTIDTLRADATSPYGAPADLTPHLAAFARRSVQFDRAFTVMPTTGPSHLAMLTGLYPQQVGALQNGMAARPRTRSLAEIMRQSGRRTAAIVSVHHLSRETLRLEGFEHWDAPDEVRDGAKTIDAAEAWIDDVAGAPFFLWVHLFDPHAPYKAHDDVPGSVADSLGKLADVEAPSRSGFDAAGLTPSQQAKLALLYQADVHYADQQVGRLLAWMERRGLADRTAVVVTSDHGEVLGEALGEFGYGFDHGEFLLPMEVRVPLWVSLPEGRRGVVEAHTVETRAIFGTLATAAAMPQPGAPTLPGLGPPADAAPARGGDAFMVRRSFQATNLPDVLRGTRLGLARDDQLLVRIERDRAVHVDAWQCGDAHPTALMRMVPPEQDVARGLAQIEQWRERVDAPGTPAAAPVDAATRERLRALGYMD